MPKGSMANVKIEYVKAYTDKTGVRRHYFRRRGHSGGVLPGALGSPEFMEAYQGYMAVKVQPNRKAPGTFGRIITDYYQTAHFTNLADNSKVLYRKALEDVAKKHGHKPTRLLDESAVLKMVEEVAERAPQMANLTRSVLLKMLKVAFKRKWISRLITGEDIPLYKGGTVHTWTQEEMDSYEARWPLGTRERLIYCALLYTGQRGGDVVKITRRDAISGWIPFEQEKTGADVGIGVHQEFAAAIKAGPANGIATLLGNRSGRPMTRRTLTDIIKRAVKAAGLDKRCKPHGLRKAILTRMAENGASDKELAAVSGHKSAKEIARYTAAASQKILARGGLSKMTKSRTPGV